MLQKIFGLDKSKTNVKTEIIAGLTTFLTMAYILAVNPNILSITGMDKGALFTATVIASFIPTLLMGIYAKLPFALAPGMGLNAFFRLYSMPRYGLYLAVRSYCRVVGGFGVYLAHSNQLA